ncbi:hypothetical protein PVAND_013286 [Polypedilum vanderplanki]|uniref:Tudor domain-containing protein n=1 Tax=Polypedilum vanderplanki TaxID=319348 RepID=A0A9J6CP79_POLVA|nr:hypothetical protein PVAND_013286 [Polypedilum vanderplanki]
MSSHCNNISEQSKKEKKSFKFSFSNWSDIEDQNASVFSYSEESNDSFMSNSFENKPYSYGKEAIVTSVGLDVFTVQLKERILEMKSFLNKLQTIANEAEPLTNFEKGEQCLVKNPFNSNWIRAIIIDAHLNDSSTLITVENFDNGCTYSFENINEFKKYPIKAKYIDYYGVKFMLPLRIHQDHKEYFNKYMLQMVNQTISYKILCKFEYAYVVDMIYQKVNVVNQLLKENMAVKLEFLPSSIVEIVNIQKLSEFYIHFNNDENWKNITINVLNYKKKKLNEVPKIGSLIMARNTQCCFNGCWHRAKLISRVDDNLHVLLIDFGCVIKITQDDVGAMDKKISKLKSVAHRCSLYLPKGIFQTDEAIKKFKEIALEKDFYVCTIKAEEDHTIVTLTTNNSETKDVTTQIIPYCEKNSDLEISSELSTITEESSSII